MSEFDNTITYEMESPQRESTPAPSPPSPPPSREPEAPAARGRGKRKNRRRGRRAGIPPGSAAPLPLGLKRGQAGRDRQQMNQGSP